MTQSEATKLVAFMQAAFPRAELRPTTIQAYTKMLEDLPYTEARSATAELVSTNIHFPAIAEIRTAVAERLSNAPSAEDALSEVMRAVSREGRYRSPAWSHPAVSAAVDAIGWQDVCSSDAPDVLRAQFLRIYAAYRTRAVKEENLKTLPIAQRATALAGDAVKQLMKGLRHDRRNEVVPGSEDAVVANGKPAHVAGEE